jgi:stage V sporulation protein AA
MNGTLYLKIDRNIQVDHVDVRLGDVAKLECTDAAVKNRLKTLKLMKIQAEKSDRYIFSVLKVVELIHEIYPSLEVQNLGEPDFIIEYESPEYAHDRWSMVKVVVLCILIFFGSAFSIITFNNDVGINQVFHQVYSLIMGEESDGFTMLEFTYSLGISVGIIIFYNHFGGKRITKDPTPIEVQMRLYEDDVNSTLIEGCNRKETNIDVD